MSSRGPLDDLNFTMVESVVTPLRAVESDPVAISFAIRSVPSAVMQHDLELTDLFKL